MIWANDHDIAHWFDSFGKLFSLFKVGVEEVAANVVSLAVEKAAVGLVKFFEDGCIDRDSAAASHRYRNARVQKSKAVKEKAQRGGKRILLHVYNVFCIFWSVFVPLWCYRVSC